MDWQIVDPSLNIIIKCEELDWQPAVRKGKKIHCIYMYITAIKIVARL